MTSTTGIPTVEAVAPVSTIWRRYAAATIKPKPEGGWKLQRTKNGDHQWTSPLDHIYTTKRGQPD